MASADRVPAGFALGGRRVPWWAVMASIIAAEAPRQLQRLASIEPEFQALTMDRDVLQSSVRDFTVKERQNDAARQIASLFEPGGS